MNATDSDGDAAVSLAVLYGHDKCLRLLIGAGVDVISIKTAKTLNHDEMKEIEAARKGRALVPHTVPVGSPILHVAVYEGFDTCVNELIEAGADVNIVPHGGEPAVLTAVRKGYPKCVAALVAAGADVNIKDKSITRSSAIDGTITRGDPEILKLLLMANVAENELITALNRASSHHDNNKSHSNFLESQLAANKSEDNSSSRTSGNITENLQKAKERITDSMKCVELLLSYNTNKIE